MWVRAKDTKQGNPRAYNILGVYINRYNNISYLYGYIDPECKYETLLGEYGYDGDGGEKKAKEAFERIMTAIVNGGKLVDLSREIE